MKKAISALLSAAIGFTALCTPVSAISDNPQIAKQSNENSIVILGDSIAAGSSRNGEIEYKYGDICADYLGYDVEYFANDGWRTDDLMDLLGNDSEAITAASDAEVIVISIGGNNLIRHSIKFTLDYAAQKNSSEYPILNSGYTSSDIPDDPTTDDFTRLLNKSVLKSYFLNNISEVQPFITNLKKYLAGTTANPTGFVQTEIVPETKEIVDRLQTLNPDADIIVQTVYQPFQFSQEFWNENFTGDSDKESYGQVINRLRSNLESAMVLYRSELQTIEGIKIADVYNEFTSVESPKLSDQGYAHYFTDIQSGGVSFDLDSADIHPNQKGHLAIAAAVLEQIGILHDDDGLLSYVYNNLSDKDDYPAIALETYQKVAGTYTPPTIIPGDVTGDGKVTAIDSAKVLEAYAVLQTYDVFNLTEDQKIAADVTKDGSITAIDAAKILTYYAYTATAPADEIIPPEEYFGN